MPSADLIQHVEINLEAVVSQTEWISKVMKIKKACQTTESQISSRMTLQMIHQRKKRNPCQLPSSCKPSQRVLVRTVANQ